MEESSFGSDVEFTLALELLTIKRSFLDSASTYSSIDEYYGAFESAIMNELCDFQKMHKIDESIVASYLYFIEEVETPAESCKFV